MTRRLGLVLPPCDGAWRRFNLQRGFAGIALQATMAGWQVDLITTQPIEPPPGAGLVLIAEAATPIIAGPGSGDDTRSLRIGHLVWRQVRDAGYDVLLGPVAGGILQPCLMSRALGESLGDTAILLWGDVPTATRVRYGDQPAGLRALVDDALERVCLTLADAVAGPVSVGARPHIAARLPADDAERPPRRPGPHTVPVLVGPGSRAYGADRFLAAAERDHPASGIAFAGPWRTDAPGLGKTMLGIRALDWRFPFAMLDAGTPDAAIAALADRDAIAIFAGPATDDDVLIATLLTMGVPVALAADHRLAAALAGSIAILPAAGFGDLVTPVTPPPDTDWAALLADIPRPKAQAARPASVTVCITHRDRPAELAAAIAGIGGGAGIVVADVGSVTPDAEAALARHAADGVRVLRLGPSSQGAACDEAVARANGDVVAFLDDDNVYIDNGLRRLVAALTHGPFDIVVSNLALYDGPAGIGAAAVVRIFLGDAGLAGLAFNGFGDTGFAIRRDAFHAIGGFRGHEGAALDWVFLARARAAGLRIGVLQAPAIGYRRDLGAADRRWRKRDSEGARATVRDAYGLGDDDAIVIDMAMTPICNTD